MSVGFGFSVGDFIAAISLVSTVFDALRETGNSSTEYRALMSQLYMLETALLRVKQLDLDESQQAELTALRQAATQCQRTIDDFWKKTAKFQPSLRAGGSSSRTKDSWMKIKWALCRKQDLIRFKADLMAHTQSIDLLLTTVLMAGNKTKNDRNNENHRSLLGQVQFSYFSTMQRLAMVLESVSSGVQQGKQLLEMIAQIIQTNVKVFQIVLSIHDIITRMPNQVNRLQPVFLVDALGRDCTFHLESIRSAEALRAVLKINFETAGSVTSKIDEGAFAIRDCATGREIDLSSPWEGCFSPGQRAEMSVILFSYERSVMNCPKCYHACDGRLEEDIQCSNCAIIFQCSVRKPKLQQESLLAADNHDAFPFYEHEDPLFHKYEDLPLYDRLREFQKFVPERRFSNRQLDSLRKVLIYILVPTPLRKDTNEDVEDAKNNNIKAIKGGNQDRGNEELDCKLAENPPTNPLDETERYIKCICDGISDTEQRSSVVRCISCYTWQHSVCYYKQYNQYDPGLEQVHLCFSCNPPYDPHDDDSWCAC